MANLDKLDFEIDPELAAIWKKTGLPKLFFPRVDNMAESRRLHAGGNRRFMKSAFVRETLGGDAVSPQQQQQWVVEEEDRSVVVRDGTPITIRVYRPQLAATTGGDCGGGGGLPVMVYAHSGGWCLGGLDTEEFICRLLVKRLRIVIVSMAYRLAPEYPYPTGIYDCYDVIKWVAANPSSVGGDLSKGFLTGGVSGGGNVTNIATILARDDALQPALTGHLYVCTGMPFQLPNASGDGFAINLFPDKLANGGSWETYKNGPVASRSMNEFYGGLAKCDPHDPLFTPFHLTDYSNMGPIFYQVAGMDIWKDSAFVYCDKVKEAGGQVKLEYYPGLPHTWWSMYPQLSINKKWAKDLVEGVDWLLRQSQSQSQSQGGQKKVMSKL